MASEYFHYFDLDNAAEITLGGRTAIQYIANCINTYFSEDFIKHAHKYYPNHRLTPGCVEKKIVAVIDTDSCHGFTYINTNMGKITIENLYNQYARNIAEVSKDNFSAQLQGLESLSYSKDTHRAEYKNILGIKKHLVKKRMYKITHKENSVVVTEDHSVIVMRNGSVIDISAKDIVKGDRIIMV